MFSDTQWKAAGVVLLLAVLCIAGLFWMESRRQPEWRVYETFSDGSVMEIKQACPDCELLTRVRKGDKIIGAPFVAVPAKAKK